MKRKLFAALMSLLAYAYGNAQSISLLTPNSGTPGQSTDVMIRGMNTHFQSGLSQASFGADIVVQKLTVLNQLTATATIRINANASPGLRTVQVKTGSETAELIGGFEVFTGAGNFRANLELMPLEAIYLSDMDISNPSASPVMFFINLYNDGVPRTVNVSVSISAQSRGYIGKLTARNKSLTADQYLRITNRDFSELDLNGAIGNKFVKDVRASGSFPPDNYSYDLKVVDKNGNELASGSSTTLIATNKVNPELIIPGAPFSAEIQDVYNPFPLFQWFGQVDKYDLYVYELTPGQTAEEVVRSLPVFKKTDITGNNFLYPVYAEKLQHGKTYAWQIQGQLSSASGTEYLPSPVFRFRFNGGGDTNPADLTVSSIQITPTEIELAPGATIQFNAQLFDKDNNLIVGAQPQWAVSSPKGTISSNGLFVAGSQPATLAVIVKSGSITEFATVSIRPNPVNTQVNTTEWMIDGMIKQLFGLPN